MQIMSGARTLRLSRKVRRKCPESEPPLEIMPFKVRPYRTSDSEAVSQICRQSPEAAQWPIQRYEQAHGSGQIVLIAVIDAQVCGFLVARVSGGEGEILNTAIDPAHRRKGVGSLLLTTAISEAQVHNAKSIYLEVRESNRAAISFYRQHGFAKSAGRHGYYSTP